MPSTPMNSALSVPARVHPARAARLFLRWAIALLLPASLAAAAPSSATAPSGGAAPTPKSAFQDQVAAIEAELAVLLFGAATRRCGRLELSLVDFQIDLRLTERWILTVAIESKPDDELNASASLRVGTLRAVGVELAQRILTSGRGLAPAQLDGLAKLHQLTYQFPESRTVETVDDVCRIVARALMLACGPTAEEAKKLPLMRPQPFPDGAGPPGPAPRTLAELTQRAKQVQVGPALKHQLAGLAALAATAAGDPKTQDEARQAYDLLLAAVDVSDGLERNTGVDAVARPKVEQQLTEGLTLFTDIRTRSAGAQRVVLLTQYRDTLARVQNLQLSEAMQKKLSKLAFALRDQQSGARRQVFSMRSRNTCNCAPGLDNHKSPTTLCPHIFTGRLTPSRSSSANPSHGILRRCR